MFFRPIYGKYRIHPKRLVLAFLFMDLKAVDKLQIEENVQTTK
jgi:hypothetical protein